MIHHTIACLCIFSFISIIIPQDAKAYQPVINVAELCMEDIDSLDKVIFDLDKMVIIGQIIEIPVYIYSDDMINTLDFSMSINVENLEFESIIDHTGEMQYAAYLNPNDLKLRFTSNSFSPYPVGDFKVISIRFKVLSSVVHSTDFEMIVAYLNGDASSATMEGTDVMVASHEIITTETFVHPNPAHDVIYVNTGNYGKLDIYDMDGKSVIDSQVIEPGDSNLVDLHWLPKGTYTVRIVTQDHKIKIQKVVLL
ncbi:MAG TPA: T9SS type A sorting domain-containing protein [Saprospiraceae bacterium]|nr:T9SS type A sorting domain-containing protein [Saprospiraceae bacterium]